jgi:hypothetical protein
MKNKKNNRRNIRGISPVISTIIISGTLLIILVIASFVATNLLELQIANTEFEQAKTNMMLLDDVIQDVALRPGSGGYVQLNQRSGGIGIYESSEKIKVKVLELSKQTTYILKLGPNTAGTYQEWAIFGDVSTRWQATNDSNDSTGIQVTGAGTLKDLEGLQDPSQEGAINSITTYIRAKINGETLVYNTITFVGSTSSTANNPTSGVFSLPSGWKADDVAIFWWYTSRNTKTFNPPLNVTTKYETAFTDYGRLYIGYRALHGGDSTFSWSASSAGGSTTIWGTSVFRNVDTSIIWDADSGSPRSFTAQNPDPPEVTTVTDKACVIAIFGKRDDYTSISAPNGYTLAGQGSDTAGDDASAGVAYKEKSPTGIENPSAWTLSGGASANGLVWTGALKPTGTNPVEQASILWRTYDTDYESSAIEISRIEFTNYFETRSINPNTAKAWTWDEINTLEIGVRASTLGESETIKVSEFWVEVNYTSVPFEVIPYPSDEGGLINIVYRGGSKVSGADMLLRGNNSPIVNMTNILSYLRVETGDGVKIKLDYNRVRIIETGSLPISDTKTEFIQVTFIRLEKGNMGGSDTVNVKVQNLGINTITRVYEDETIAIEAHLENPDGSNHSNRRTFSVGSATKTKIVVTFTEIVIQISTA